MHNSALERQANRTTNSGLGGMPRSKRLTHSRHSGAPSETQKLAPSSHRYSGRDAATLHPPGHARSLARRTTDCGAANLRYPSAPLRQAEAATGSLWATESGGSTIMGSDLRSSVLPVSDRRFGPMVSLPAKASTQARLPMQAPTVSRNVDLSAHGLFRKQEAAKAAPAKPETDAEEDDDASPRRSIIDAYETEEVLAIIRDVITTADPMPREDAIKAIATQLGAERVGARIRDFIDGMLNTASRRLIIETRDGGLVACTRSIDDYHRDFLKTALKAVIGHTWTDEDDALRAATRHLGFRRTGPKIERAFKSAINGLLRQNELERNGRNLRRPIE
jgi:hypothetical protein